MASDAKMSAALPFLLAVAAIVFTAWSQGLIRPVQPEWTKHGDMRHWKEGIPTGVEGDRCVGLLREQYVPFWCFVGVLVTALYGLEALRAKLAARAKEMDKEKTHKPLGCFGRLRNWRAAKIRANSVANELEEGLLPPENGAGVATRGPTQVATPTMEKVCSDCGAICGLEAASLAVLIALKQRSTYGQATVAMLTPQGATKALDIELLQPSMSFATLLSAVNAKLQDVSASTGDSETPEVVFAWKREPTDKPGHWYLKLAGQGEMAVKAPSVDEEESFKVLFEQCAAAPDANIWQLALMPEGTLHQVRAWGAPAKTFSTWKAADGHLKTVPEILYEKKALFMGDAVAGPKFCLSYKELRRRVAAVAAAVRNEATQTLGLGEGWSRAVIVFMGRGEAIAPAFLGILQAGYSVVPIDIHWPAERARSVATDSAAMLALTEGSTDDAWLQLNLTIKSLVVDAGLFGQHNHELIPIDVKPEQTAITLFTSGSTGKPKGILLSHEYVTTLAAGRAESLQMNQRTRTLLHQSPTWMPFIDYLFGPLLVGGCCVFVPEQTANHAVTPASLRDLANQHSATILGFVPPVLDIFLDEDFPAKLRCICVGGAAVPAELCTRVAAAFGKTANGVSGFLATGYHGTEQGDVTQIQVRDAGDVVKYRSTKGFMTSGRPHTTQRCAVLDQGLQMVGPNGVGEICVTGSGLAAGYLNLPDKTLETFLPACAALGGERTMRTSDLGRWTADGSLEVVGRLGSMVKVRGARVELGEVEVAVASHPAVRACVVVVHQDRLVAYVVPAVPADLRDLCKSKLASYMVPHIFEGMEQLPQLANGKVNKKALPPPSEGSTEGSETIMELDSLGQMRKLTRLSASEDRILDNVRAILMVIVIQSHATPLLGGDTLMHDLANVPMDGQHWSYLSALLLNFSRSGGWSALAYLAGFDDTRGDSPYKLTYREVLFLGLWGISGFKWTLWFLPAFVYLRVLFVIAHKLGMMKLHFLLVSQIWLTVPMVVDWYVGWKPYMAGVGTECSPHCFCPFKDRLWVESIAYYSVGMWSVPVSLISHSFIGRALFFIPCYWLGFYTGRPFIRVLCKINDDFSILGRLLTAIAAGGLYLALFTKADGIEQNFDDRCPAFWTSPSAIYTQLAKNCGFYAFNLFTSALYVIVIVALMPTHLKRLAKTVFAAYVLAAFAPFFCLVDLPVMALEVRKLSPDGMAPILETFFIFAQPVIYVLSFGTVTMWGVQVAVRSVIAMF
eukprot:TRINITY_DN8043_c0_g1_i1.p1 TRINITY_DN8043_c0_g1~~TRINITY_DN8043_c0_g1_i1.p1  ORF type:complete len:1244 (-),score=255.96 TRINITY_DN8043_c0_g1_i1:491-4222(-)